MSLPETIHLLERLTIRPPFFPSLLEQAVTEREAMPVIDWIEYFWRRWADWCLEIHDRDHDLLQEYKVILAALTGLTSGARPLRERIQDLVSDESRIRLGTVCWTLPKNWKTGCTRQETASEWAEFFLALRQHSNTRSIKERLARARRETKIEQAWREHMRWLREHPDMLQDIEVHLQGISVDSTAIMTRL